MQEKKQIELIQQEIDFMERWYQNYLRSEYASYFLGHENGQLYDGERLASLEYWKPEVVQEGPSVEIVPQEDESMRNDVTTLTAPQSWNVFIEDKFSQFLE